ncbi:MAG: putative maltokinase [Nitrospiraceae bacterium]
MLIVNERWERILEGEARGHLEACLPDLLKSRRWFAGKARAIQSVRIVESLPIPCRSNAVTLLFILVEYRDGTPETYAFPVTAALGEQAAQIQKDMPGTIVTTLKVLTKECEQTGVLYDALWNPDFSRALLSAIGQGSRFTGESGTLIASSTQAYRKLISGEPALEPAVMKAEQSNTSVAYGDRLIMKVYRRVENGVNPDLEIGRILTMMNFSHTPPVAGSIEYIRANGETITTAILQGFVHNQGDAWKYTLEAFDRYLERCRAQPTGREDELILNEPLIELAHKEIPTLAHALIGPYLESVVRIGQRTAQLHVALANVQNNPDFTPEPFSLEYRRSRYESMCRLTSQTCSLLKGRLNDLASETEQEVRLVVNSEPQILDRFRDFFELETSALRIRCHGDYHLGQVLYTGQDFVISDFEGEPARPLSERRMKHTPIMDVAGMLRSLHYAPYAALSRQQSKLLAEGDGRRLDPWVRFWSGWVSVVFLKAYLAIAGRASFWPGSQEEFQVLFDAYLLEKAVYEIRYELNNRPDWVKIPIRAVLEILETTTHKAI